MTVFQYIHRKEDVYSVRLVASLILGLMLDWRTKEDAWLNLEQTRDDS